MTIRTVLKMGERLLYQKALPEERFNTRELDQLIVDMMDTMEVLNGAGIAAPQIGESKRIVIFGVESNPRYPDADPVPFTVLINPEIEILAGDTVVDWEGCLSVPGLRGLVERPTSIRYRGYDASGAAFERDATGFHARVVQHECDHLDGILYPMRIQDPRDLVYEELLVNYTGNHDVIADS